MTQTSARSSDGALASAAAAVHVQGMLKSTPLKYVPGFLYILVLYIAGKFSFADPPPGDRRRHRAREASA
jgi:hypothetical protein